MTTLVSYQNRKHAKNINLYRESNLQRTSENSDHYPLDHRIPIESREEVGHTIGRLRREELEREEWGAVLDTAVDTLVQGHVLGGSHLNYIEYSQPGTRAPDPFPSIRPPIHFVKGKQITYNA